MPMRLHPCPTSHLKGLQKGTDQMLRYFPKVQSNTFLECKIVNISYPTGLTFVLGAQKNRLNETVLLSTHNICFG